jgi:hypothetical protein
VHQESLLDWRRGAAELDEAKRRERRLEERRLEEAEERLLDEAEPSPEGGGVSRSASRRNGKSSPLQPSMSDLGTSASSAWSATLTTLKTPGRLLKGMRNIARIREDERQMQV